MYRRSAAAEQGVTIDRFARDHALLSDFSWREAVSWNAKPLADKRRIHTFKSCRYD
jgi:hypothetical protein